MERERARERWSEVLQARTHAGPPMVHPTVDLSPRGPHTLADVHLACSFLFYVLTNSVLSIMTSRTPSRYTRR